jgi:hypothetical protein
MRMLRRLFYTVFFLAWAGCAFCNADPKPDVNLFGVMFLFFAFVVWFCWEDIQAGYAFLDDHKAPRRDGAGPVLVRFAPMYLRELIGKKPRRS